MFKKIIFPLMLVAVCLLACSCFAGNQSTDEPNATTQPGATPGQSGASTSPDPQNGAQTNPNDPNVSNLQPGMSGGTDQNSANTPANGQTSFDWVNSSSAVSDRINMFSEIQDSAIVESEGTALVGVEFAPAYQGELTQRIRDMVAGEVMAADSSIQVVAVTGEKDDVEKIRQLASQISSGSSPQDLKQQVDMIARNTTTLR